MKYRDTQGIPAGEIIQAYGYGDNAMPDGRLLNRDDLDRALPDNLIAYPFITELEAILQKYPVASWGQYENRPKIGGVKVTIDGSPKGRAIYRAP